MTFSWLRQFILCFVLHGRGSYRGAQKTLHDVFDYHLSLGTIHNIVHDAKVKAINAKQNLTNCKLIALKDALMVNWCEITTTNASGDIIYKCAFVIREKLGIVHEINRATWRTDCR